MSRNLQSIERETDTLLEFVHRTDQEGISTGIVAEFLFEEVWEKQGTLDRIIRIIETEQERQDKFETFSLTASSRTPRYVDITDVELVSGYQFEHVLAEILSRIEGAAQVTQQSGDQGVDVIWFKQSETIAVQAKAYSKGNNVSNSAVQEAFTGAQYYKEEHQIDAAAVVTTSTFTHSAQEAAGKTGVRLYDRRNVTKWLDEAQLDAETLGTLLNAETP